MATQPAARPSGQDPLRVDTKHYTVEMENDRVRVLRAKYGPYEKSVMHGHPALIAVAITDGNIRFTYPDGTVEDTTMKAGQTLEMPAVDHLPENLSGQPFEIVLIEIKS